MTRSACGFARSSSGAIPSARSAARIGALPTSPSTRRGARPPAPSTATAARPRLGPPRRRLEGSANAVAFAPVAGRALGLLILAVLGWQVFAQGLDFFRASAALRFLHGVNLIFHEAGHTIFLLFGQFLHVLGGSALQVLVPAVCAGYFLLHRQMASFAVALFWAGESITDVAVYMADAPTRALPLLGGDGVIHDWNYLLDAVGLLNWAGALATLTFGVGTLIILAALGLLVVDLLAAWNRTSAARQPESWRQP